MKTKNIMQYIVLTISLGALTVKAQELPPPDLSMLTNHAALVGYAFKQIRGVEMSVSSGAKADNWQSAGFFQVTNEIKTLETLMDIVDPVWWGLRLTDVKAYVSTYAKFWNSSDQNAINNYYYNDSGPYALFYAYGGGQPIKSSGYWTLPAEGSEMDMHIAPTIRIKIKGLIDARLVTSDQWGNAYGVSMGTSNDELWFQSDYAGTGELVLTRQYQGADGYWHTDTRGYSLTNSVEIPLTWVQFSVLLHDSEDFRSFKNQNKLEASVYAYQGYGKVPLLIATFDKDLVKDVMLSVYATDGQYATSYIIENQKTKEKKVVDVPSGATSVKTDFPGGVYYIIPVGIQLRAGYSYYYGGKG